MCRLTMGILFSQLLLAATIFAGTPDKVACPAHIDCWQCTANGSCTIQISQTKTKDGYYIASSQPLGADGKPAGSPSQAICLDSSLPVTFTPDPAFKQAFFEVVFGSNNPFAPAQPVPVVIGGGTVSGVPVKPKLPLVLNKKGCYNYDITFCQYADGSPLNCVNADPQVIVDGGDRMGMCVQACKKKKGEAYDKCEDECEKENSRSTN